MTVQVFAERPCGFGGRWHRWEFKDGGREIFGACWSDALTGGFLLGTCAAESEHSL